MARTMNGETESLLKQYRTLAKRADQRLVRLEAARYKKGYENVLKYAYAKAQKDIRKWTDAKRLQKKTPLRFNTAPPKTKTGGIDIRSLKEKIRTIERFLSSDTSTIKPTKESKGIEQLYDDRTKSINEKYGTNFTWETLAKYYEDGTAEKLSSKYGSKTALRIIAQIQKKKKDVLRELKAVNNRRIKTDNPFLSKKVNEVLNEYGTSIEKLVKY